MASFKGGSLLLKLASRIRSYEYVTPSALRAVVPAAPGAIESPSAEGAADEDVVLEPEAEPADAQTSVPKLEFSPATLRSLSIDEIYDADSADSAAVLPLDAVSADDAAADAPACLRPPPSLPLTKEQLKALEDYAMNGEAEATTVQKHVG